MKVVTVICDKGLLGPGFFEEQLEFSDDATEMEIEKKGREWIKDKCEFIRNEYNRIHN